MVRQKAVWLRTHHCIKSNTNVRTKSIRLDSNYFNTSSTQLPFYTPFCTTATTLFIHNISGSNRGLGDMKKSNCSIATNPTPAYVQKVLDWIQVFNTSSTQFPRSYICHTIQNSNPAAKEPVSVLDRSPDVDLVYRDSEHQQLVNTRIGEASMKTRSIFFNTIYNTQSI